MTLDKSTLGRMFQCFWGSASDYSCFEMNHLNCKYASMTMGYWLVKESFRIQSFRQDMFDSQRFLCAGPLCFREFFVLWHFKRSGVNNAVFDSLESCSWSFRPCTDKVDYHSSATVKIGVVWNQYRNVSQMGNETKRGFQFEIQHSF